MTLLLKEYISIYSDELVHTDINFKPRLSWKQYLSWLDQQDKDCAKEHWRRYFSKTKNDYKIDFLKDTAITSKMNDLSENKD